MKTILLVIAGILLLPILLVISVIWVVTFARVFKK